MAEERKSIPRGVVVELDFTAVDGAQILFDVAKKVLAPKGVDLTVKLEATHLVGGNYQGGLTELFEALDVTADAAAVAQELDAVLGRRTHRRRGESAGRRKRAKDDHLH